MQKLHFKITNIVFMPVNNNNMNKSDDLQKMIIIRETASFYVRFIRINNKIIFETGLFCWKSSMRFI